MRKLLFFPSNRADSPFTSDLIPLDASVNSLLSSLLLRSNSASYGDEKEGGHLIFTGAFTFGLDWARTCLFCFDLFAHLLSETVNLLDTIKLAILISLLFYYKFYFLNQK